MSGYRGDGYGQHGNVGDDDYRIGDGREERGSISHRGEGRDPRAQDAARDWQDRFGREGHEGSYALHDETYHSYRQRHIDELDRDYDEWCREREQGFHRDFDDWRSGRRTGAQPGSAMTNTGGDSATMTQDRDADSLVASRDEVKPASRQTRSR